MLERAEKNKEAIAKANEYYKNNAPKPGSMAAKANMVKMYNQKDDEK
jgi:YidC/Oxa1 family membrane protein insertase